MTFQPMGGYGGYGGYSPSKKREIADLLQHRAMDFGPKSLGEGLAQVGTALLARRANNRASSAEAEQAKARENDSAAQIAALLGPNATPQTQAAAKFAPNAVAQAILEREFAQSEAPEPFTLKAGETRFDGMGNQVATVEPESERPWWAGEGGHVDPSMLAYREAGAPSTSVTVGAPEQPNPYAQFADGTMIEAPPGTSPLKDGQYWEVQGGRPSVAVADNSPAAQEAAMAEEKASIRREYDARSGRTVLREVNRGIDLLDTIYGEESASRGENEVQFGPGQVAHAMKRQALAMTPGTAEYVFQANIRSAKSNIGLDRLQGVRDFSPTGGALGQIPVQQQEKLEETIGALGDLGLPRPFLEENLRSANNDYLDIIYGTPSQRRGFVEQGIITPEDNAWIDAQYDSLGYDAYGNYMLGDPNYTRPVIGATLPDGTVFTEEDLQATMAAEGMSRLEVEAMVRASLR